MPQSLLENMRTLKHFEKDEVAQPVGRSNFPNLSLECKAREAWMDKVGLEVAAWAAPVEILWRMAWAAAVAACHVDAVGVQDVVVDAAVVHVVA